MSLLSSELDSGVGATGAFKWNSIVPTKKSITSFPTFFGKMSLRLFLTRSNFKKIGDE